MMKTRYAIRVGSQIYDAGTEVVPADIKLVRKAFGNMEFNENSNQIAVVFPKRTHCTIVDKSQLIMNERNN